MRKALKWVGITLGTIFGLIILFAATIYIWSEIRINQTYQVKVEKIDIPTDQASIDEGHRLFISRGCVDCHGENAQGVIFLNDPAVGMLAGPNLTKGKGGLGKIYNDEDFIRAIRYGVKKDGKPLVFMPSNEFYYLHDKELAAMIAYIKSTKPINNTPPKTSPGPVFRALDVLGMNSLFPGLQNLNKKHKNVDPAPTVEYGEVLAKGCIGCHGEGLSGGAIPGAPSTLPIALNITPDTKTGIGNWTFEDFKRAVCEGIRPNGAKINPFMPWKNLSKLNDVELQALWTYLRSVQPKEYGNR